MHRIYYSLNEDCDEITLTGDTFHYISRVIRLSTGDTLVLFDESGLERVGEILSLDRQSVKIRLGEKHQNRCEPEYPVWLILGLPKGTKYFDIIRSGVALGIAGMIPFLGERSVGGRGGKSGAWMERCRKIAIEACRQCGRSKIPSFLAPAPSLESALKQLNCRETELKLCFWEEAKDSLSSVIEKTVPRNEDRTLLILGPEGGLTQEEVALSESQGFRPCHLGPRILRTELAPLVALSLIQQHLGQMEQSPWQL